MRILMRSWRSFAGAFGFLEEQESQTADKETLSAIPG